MESKKRRMKKNKSKKEEIDTNNGAKNLNS